jgi:CheY-like chemotaxis protein
MSTILIVDDEAAVRSIIYSELAPKHFVLEASNGHEGLYLYNLYNPDVVIIDQKMPVMSGLNMIQRLRTTPQQEHLKIIAMTDLDNFPDDSRALLEAGANQCISKPIANIAKVVSGILGAVITT